MQKYDHKQVEVKWQETWNSDKVFAPDKDTQGEKGNFYLLDMFPYPSGDGLHMGHTEGYTATDVLYRFKRMSGHNVLHPQGFDSFGLPAENYAIKTGTHPSETTKTNSDNYLRQWNSLGLGHDFSNLVYTSSPDYYKWTQLFFGSMMQHGLAYQKTDTVNWCPSCNTILANEQVESGQCERCKSQVIQKDIPAWFFKITDFADELIEGLEDVDWPEPTKKKQINWIGKSQGAEIDFQIKDRDEKITVFTTRADTLFGATYVVLAPEHPLVKKLFISAQNQNDIQKYLDDTKAKTELERLESKEKTGVLVKGITAINPANNKEIPIYIADYVLGGYGTGAVMAVPAHDERDFEFATKFNLPKDIVIDGAVEDECYGDKGTLVNSGDFSGTNSDEAIPLITKKVGGRLTNTYRLRDWSISRQRYWGTPIPVVYDPEGKAHFVGEENLPWLLPTDVDFIPTGESPLAKSQELQERVTKLFGEGWRPEYDTMDTFVDSAWYFLRYPDTDNESEFCSPERLKTWLPKGVDLYIGGAEHTYMHLLYARFFTKALQKIGIIDFSEPFKKLRHQGMVLDKNGVKMSKSKGNVTNPDEMVERFGADAVRTYMMFAAPLEDDVVWNEDNIVGVYRFLEKVWALREESTDADNKEIESDLQLLIRDVTNQIENLKLNTVVSDMMKFINKASKVGIGKNQYRTFLQLLSPYAPHIADELTGETLITTSWPEFDESLVQTNSVVIGVQVNGKRRGDIEITPDATQDQAIDAAREVQNISKWLSEGEIKKVIYVPGKILNILVG